MDSTKDLPLSPKSWFYLANVDEISGKPKAFKVANLDIVVFRNEQNIAVAFDRHCPHMNADLALGKVVNNRLQCSLHRWEYDAFGICKHIPNATNDKIPKKAFVKSYPVKERNGFLFIFNNETALFELPFFQGLNSDQYDSSSVQTITIHNAWFVGAANAFDLAHFETVHLRHLLKEPIVSSPHPNAYRIELDYKILGRTLSDRLMKGLYGPRAQLDFTVYAGNFILAVTTVAGLKNYMMIVNGPVGADKAEAKLMVYSKKTHNPFKKIKREIQASFSRKFFQDEANQSQGVFIDNNTLGPNDSVIKNYLKWLMSVSN